MASTRERIHALAKHMTASELKIANVLLNDPEPFRLAIGGLASQSQVSEATVVRFYRRLGYSSYQELKVALAQEAADGSSRTVYEEISRGDSCPEVFAKVVEQTVEALRSTSDMIDKEALVNAADLVAKAKRLIFLGVGASGAIAMDAAHKFLRLGGSSTALTDPHLQAIAASHMNHDDLVVAISHSGESTATLAAVQQAKASGAKVIAITGYANSSLCGLADVSLVTAAREAQYRSDAMASRLVQLALIDSLYVSLVLGRGPKAVEALNRSRLAVARLKT